MSAWVDRTEALTRLGVRPETLYAYVSRGRIERRADPDDPRRSLYSAAQIDALAQKRDRGRHASAIAESALAWGEPAVVTSISTVSHGRLIYRGVDAVALSEHATLEDAAKLLWQTPASVTLPSVSHIGAPGRASAFASLAALSAQDQSTINRSATELHADAATCVAAFARALGADAGNDPMHVRIARGWNINDAGTDAIRRALVLLADHELNASTFATRVAASTGASIAACLLAGFATLSGPLHGGAAGELQAFLRDASARGREMAIADFIDRDAAIPGFGHPLYPDGDPRAASLVNIASVDDEMNALRAAVLGATGAIPNIDFALLALVRTYQLPADAPFRLFAIGRSVGWAAHAMEQAATHRLIRARARYEGPLPAD